MIHNCSSTSVSWEFGHWIKHYLRIFACSLSDADVSDVGRIPNANWLSRKSHHANISASTRASESNDANLEFSRYSCRPFLSDWPELQRGLQPDDWCGIQRHPVAGSWQSARYVRRDLIEKVEIGSSVKSNKKFFLLPCLCLLWFYTVWLSKLYRQSSHCARRIKPITPLRLLCGRLPVWHCVYIFFSWKATRTWTKIYPRSLWFNIWRL